MFERALQHDNGRVLLRMAYVLRPVIIELERLVASPAELAHQETYRRLALLLTDTLKERLDKLLIVDSDLKLW